MSRRSSALCSVALVALLGACASKDADAVAVRATDTACEPAETHFDAGKITFEVKNDGKKVTELYVYGKGDKVISEVENIGPAASRKLSVNLKAGEYELACKPGMTGNGIRTEIMVSGRGGEDSAESATADREIEVTAVDYSFSNFEPALDVKTGETIKFELLNKGKEKHEFEVIGPDGKAVGEVEAIDPGAEDDATIAFDKAGKYTYECHVADHHERGMHGDFTVS
jgi:uncharacterized cupredoxin-like copper-binding protein